MLDILFDYVTKNGTTLVTVTHDHDLLGRFGRVIEFKDVHTGGDGQSIGSGRQKVDGAQ